MVDGSPHAVRMRLDVVFSRVMVMVSTLIQFLDQQEFIRAEFRKEHQAKAASLESRFFERPPRHEQKSIVSGVWDAVMVWISLEGVVRVDDCLAFGTKLGFGTGAAPLRGSEIEDILD